MNSNEDKNQHQIVNSFNELKQGIKQKFIRDETRRLLEKDRNLTADQLIKKFKISKATFMRAFDRKTPEQKGKKFDISSLIGFLGKAGIGLGSLSILDSPKVLGTLKYDIEKLFLDQRHFGYLISAGLIFWNKFIKAKLNDTKNNMSEIEVFLKLMDSKAMFVGLGLGGITLIIPQIIRGVERSMAFVQDLIQNGIPKVEDKFNTIVNNVEDKTETDEECIGDSCFPSFKKWLKDHWQFWNPMMIYLAFPTYLNEKKRWRFVMAQEQKAHLDTVREEEALYDETVGTGGASKVFELGSEELPDINDEYRYTEPESELTYPPAPDIKVVEDYREATPEESEPEPTTEPEIEPPTIDAPNPTDIKDDDGATAKVLDLLKEEFDY